MSSAKHFKSLVTARMELFRSWPSSTLLLFTFLYTVACQCYFPMEFLGTYLMQTQSEANFDTHATVTFSEVSFDPDAIPPWGKCFRRRGNNVILKDSTGGEDCMRCFHLTLKASNIIQIHTEGLARCYTKEETVRATCPDDRAVNERKFKEIMLYRKQESSGNMAAAHVFCPLSGKFRFTYTARNGEFRCDQTLSEVSNCPFSNVLVIKFRKCSFPDMDISFRCLGDWEGNNSDRYLALMDLRASVEERSTFRCGMYRVDPLTGRVFVSLSADSTCYNQLRSSTDGYESLILTPFPEKSPPGPVLQAHCRFPSWIQGAWEGMQVVGNVLAYNDPSLLQRYSLTCLKREDGDRFIVFASTHCGEESYNCIWLKQRSVNVMEFQIGSQPSHLYSDTLCHDLQFNDELWTTQGRLKPIPMFPCPITGDYTGILPENPGLCAKVASDCNNPDIMFYTVSNCRNKSQVFEATLNCPLWLNNPPYPSLHTSISCPARCLCAQPPVNDTGKREYRCLGSWEEPGGVTFTYTQRREMVGFQCFSGKVLESGREAYIKEAGHSCIRGENPRIYGMKITKHSSCPNLGMSMTHRPRYPTTDVSDINDPLYRSIPNDPHWYQKGHGNQVDTRDRKPPTRSTKEDDTSISSSTLISAGILLFLCLPCSWFLQHPQAF